MIGVGSCGGGNGDGVESCDESAWDSWCASS